MSKAAYDRKTAARRGVLAAMRNGLWVVLVTTLVWVYADMEFLTEQDYGATLRLTASNKETTLLPADQSQQAREVSFRVRGTRAQLDSLARWLGERNGVLTYDVSRDFGPSRSPHSENVKTILERVVSFRQRGLEAVWTEPTLISFRLDRRVKVGPLPVEFQYANVTLAAPPVVKPPKVSVYVAESAWAQVEAALPEAARKLRTRQVDLKNVPADKPIIAELIPSIAMPGEQPAVPVEPEVDSVRVEFQVEHQKDTKKFNVTPRIVMPPAWAEDDTWAEYRLVRKPNETWTKEIIVEGAKADVSSLQVEDIDAYIVLREDDKKPVPSWLTRDVILRFPPKLKVELAATEKPTVSFRLEKRTAATPP